MMINNFLINISSGVNSQTKSVTDYFGLRKRNHGLVNRITELQNNKNLVKGATDFGATSVTYIDVNKRDNYLIIDKGANDGIKLSTIVITPENSIVGRVRHTTTKNSLVQTVMSKDFNITTQLIDGTIGLAYWDGQKYGYLKMKNIPSYVKIKKGDKVVTSGKGIFPGGVAVGSIDNITVDEATKFYTVDIKLATNFYKLDQVLTLEEMDHQVKDTLIQIRDSLTDDTTKL